MPSRTSRDMSTCGLKDQWLPVILATVMQSFLRGYRQARPAWPSRFSMTTWKRLWISLCEGDASPLKTGAGQAELCLPVCRPIRAKVPPISSHLLFLARPPKGVAENRQSPRTEKGPPLAGGIYKERCVSMHQSRSHQAAQRSAPKNRNIWLLPPAGLWRSCQR